MAYLGNGLTCRNNFASMVSRKFHLKNDLVRLPSLNIWRPSLAHIEHYQQSVCAVGCGPAIDELSVRDANYSVKEN